MPRGKPKQGMLTVNEVARMLEVCAPTVRKWLREARIEHYRFVGPKRTTWLIPSQAVATFLRNAHVPVGGRTAETSPAVRIEHVQANGAGQ